MTHSEWSFAPSLDDCITNGGGGPFRDVLAEIQRHPPSNVLEYVKLRVSLHPGDMVRWIIDKEDWLPLATSFANCDTFPCLKEVKVDVVGWGDDFAVDDEDTERNDPILDLYNLPFKFSFSPKEWCIYPSYLDAD